MPLRNHPEWHDDPELARVDRLARRASEPYADYEAEGEAYADAGNPVSRTESRPSVWARITGVGVIGSRYLYSWVQVENLGGDAPVEALDEGARLGGDYNGDSPAQEVTNRADVPTGLEAGAVVRMWQSGDDDRWLFQYGAPAAEAGSGPAGSGGCPEAVVYRTTCVQGLAYRYKSYLSVSDGCITQSPWQFDSMQGCCECSGSGADAGSGGGSGGGGGGGGGGPPPVGVGCCDYPVAQTVALTVTGNGACSGCSSSGITLTYDPAEFEPTWKGSTNLCGFGSVNITLICIFSAVPGGGRYDWQLSATGSCAFSVALSTASCSPLLLDAAGVTVGCCGGTIDLTITDV